MSNILEVTFDSGQTFATAERLWKGDYGQVLLIHGPELPAYYEVHFSSTKDGTPEVSVGTPEGVNIPNRLLQAEGHIYAWVFLHVGEHDGETKFQVKIPVEERGIPIDQETPEDQTAVQQAIAALNAETGRAEAAADAASVSEQNAKASEDAALLSEQNAETAAQAAAASAENAALSEDGAAESEAAAAISAQEAAASAAAAAASAAEAGGSEQTVAEYARQAGEAADTALQYGVLAVQSAQDAEASAQTAETYGEAAIEAKTTATTAAATATQKAQEASTNAGIAASHAATAVSKATEAVQSANEAAQSASDAMDSAEDADDSAASARLHNEQAQAASTAAQTAAENASAAQTAAEAAQTAAETAQDGAEDAQDAAEAAQSSAEAAQTVAEAAKTAAQTAQTAAEAAQYVAEDAADQAQEWAERVPNMLPVDTADGPVASFPDGADDIPLKSLIVDINLVQDLHGYDSPWPAGGGKNLADYTNIDWGTVSDGWITYNPNVTSVTNTPMPTNIVAGQDYCITIERSAASATYVSRIQLFDANNNKVYDNNGWATVNPFVVSVNLASNAVSAVVTIKEESSGTVKTGTFRIQIEKGSTSTAWTPYENLCPISGWSEVAVEQRGKNLLNNEASVFSNVGLYKICKLNLPTGTNLFMSFEDNDTSVDASSIFFGFVLDDYTSGTLPSGTYKWAKIPSVTSPTNIDNVNSVGTLCSVVCYPATDEALNTFFARYKVTVTVGTTASSYTPYNPSSRDIVIQLGDTYYGAQIDVLTGVLRVMMVSVDLGELDWRYYTSGGSSYFYADVSGKHNGFNNFICSVYPVRSAGDKIIRGYTSSNRVSVIDSSYTDVTDFEAFITGQTICYELATPIEIQLTPQEINSLLGTNNIWADTGDTHVIYRADIGLYIQKLTGSTEEDMTANQNIASGKYFLVGNTLYLSTSAIAAGEQIIPGTNCTLTNLAAALNALNS